MSESLEELRETWERGLEVKAVFSKHHTSLVILTNDDAPYNEAFHFHRYFALAESGKKENVWHISADVQNGSLEEIWRTISRMLLTSHNWTVELKDFKL